MVRPMVHSTKHYVQNSLATILGSAQLTLVPVEAVTVAAKTAVHEVEEGSTVKAVYFEQWIRAGDTVGGSFIAVLAKVPSGAGVFTTTEMAALGTADNKKNILWTSQGLVNDQDADALGMMRGWYKIPKSKQRMGLGDRIVLNIFAQGAIDLHICGFTTYKEYS